MAVSYFSLINFSFYHACFFSEPLSMSTLSKTVRGMRQMHDRGHSIDLVCACPQMLAGLWGGGERRAVSQGVSPETSEKKHV